MKKFEIELEDDLAEMLEDLSINTKLPISQIVSYCMVRRITLNSDAFNKYRAMVRKEMKQDKLDLIDTIKNCEDN